MSAYFVWRVTADHCWMMDNWTVYCSPGPPAHSAVGLPLETVELLAYLEGQRERKKESKCLRFSLHKSVIIYTLNAVTNPYDFHFSVELKSPALNRRSQILFSLVPILIFLVTLWFCCMEKSSVSILQNSFFCVSQKKAIQHE